MSKDDAAFAVDDLLAWNDANAKIWYALASEHAGVLDVPCDIYKAETIGQLLQHIVAAELRYAERLSDVPATDYAAIPFGSAEEIFATHERAFKLFSRLVTDEGFDWNAKLEFVTLTAGKLRATRKVVLHQALLHGIRHYAQLATLARQHGFKSTPADYLITNCEFVET